MPASTTTSITGSAGVAASTARSFGAVCCSCGGTATGRSDARVRAEMAKVAASSAKAAAPPGLEGAGECGVGSLEAVSGRDGGHERARAGHERTLAGAGQCGEERERDERGRAEGDLDREAADQHGAEHVHEEQDAAGSEPVAEEAAGWHGRSTGDAVGGQGRPWRCRPAVAGQHVPRQRHRVAGVADRRRCLAADEQPDPAAAAWRGALRGRFPLLRRAGPDHGAAGPFTGGRGGGRPRSVSSHQVPRAGGMGCLCRGARRRPAAGMAVRSLDGRRPRDGLPWRCRARPGTATFLVRCRLRR